MTEPLNGLGQLGPTMPLCSEESDPALGDPAQDVKVQELKMATTQLLTTELEVNFLTVKC